MKSTDYHPSMHLDGDQLLAADQYCPVCGSTSVRSIAGLIQSSPSVYLLNCSTCGGCSASRMPSPNVLDHYYRHYFHGPGPRITLPGVDALVNRLTQVIRPAARTSHLRVLDFGGGDGTIGVAIAKKLRAEHNVRTACVTLVDYQTPVEIGMDRLKVLHRQQLEQVEGPFDLVLASAVLEHIPGLQPIVKRLLSMLAPGGWFYARTPYMAPLKRLLPELDLTYPGHVHDLGPRFWNRVPKTYDEPVRIVVSRPSLIETSLFQHPVRTVAAWLMKLPARIELALSSSTRVPRWRLVGGWEVILQRSWARAY